MKTALSLLLTMVTLVPVAEAQRSYDEVLRLAKEHEDNFEGEKALPFLDEALRLRPDAPDVLLRRGRAQPDKQAAMRDFKRVLELQPDSAEAHLAIGSHIGRWNAEEGLRLIDRALELKPKWAQAYYDRGEVKLLHSERKDKERQAFLDFDLAIRADPRFGLDRAATKRYLGKYKEAIADYDGLIAKYPKAASAYWERGEAKKKLGRIADGQADLDKAASMDSYYGSPQQETMDRMRKQKDRCRGKRK
jgi:tetratricopeptide (TPR) repeat protein